MKLYYHPRSRAAIAKWMLDECGPDYEIVPIDFQKREHKAPEFLKINPAGKLPALVDGDSRIFESAAICLYLGDKFPQANLAPQIGAPERGRYLSLMVYSMIGSMFIWKRLWGGPPDRPKLEAYVDRLLQRPAAMKLSG
jgi:glutathione S-transferase